MQNYLVVDIEQPLQWLLLVFVYEESQQFIENGEVGRLVQLQLPPKIPILLLNLTLYLLVINQPQLLPLTLLIQLPPLVKQNISISTRRILTHRIVILLPPERLPPQIVLIEQRHRLVVKFVPPLLMLYQRIVVPSLRCPRMDDDSF